MAGKNAAENPGVSWDSAKQIDQLCDEFEAAWSNGQKLRIEELLSALEVLESLRVFGKLVVRARGADPDEQGESESELAHCPRVPARSRCAGWHRVSPGSCCLCR